MLGYTESVALVGAEITWLEGRELEESSSFVKAP
jgi:hypothetical protein